MIQLAYSYPRYVTYASTTGFAETDYSREARRLRQLAYSEMHRRKAIAAFPVIVELAAEPPAIEQPEPEPRVPTARRAGCRARGRRPVRSRPGVRR